MTPNPGREGKVKMRNIDWDFMDCAKRMPELVHHRKDQEYNIMESEVAEWLCKQPEIRRKIFSFAKQKKLIVYDPEKGTWKGVNYRMIKYVFISMPMNGKSYPAIREQMHQLFGTALANNLPGRETYELISHHVREDFDSDQPVRHLGNAIQAMSIADYVVFAKGWKEARGCRIEHEIAEAYGLNIIEL